MKKFSGQLKQALKEAGPVIKVLARLGYAAKGIVYLFIGFTGVVAAIKTRSETEDFEGVLLKIFKQPFGRILLILLAVGLAGYSLWCLIQALLDTEKKGSRLPGILLRSFYAGVGIVYAGLAWSAIQIVSGTGRSQRGDRPEQEWTSIFLKVVPHGGWIIALIGAGFVLFCLYELRRAFSDKFEILKPEREDKIKDEIGTVIGQIGISARAAVFAIIGIFLVRAGVDFDPSKVHGIGGALNSLLEERYGAWVLAVIAFGLVAYGVYMFFLSWLRRVDPI